MNLKTLRWINSIAFLMMILINALANLVPFGIGTTGAVSQKYENLFTPAPVTFYVWGVIYIFMALFVAYQWGWFDKGQRSPQLTERIGLWFALSCLSNIGWIFAWHFDAIFLSLIMIVCLLLTLLVIVEKRFPFQKTTVETISVRVGFDIYFGWIIVATIANVCVLLTKIGWKGFGIPQTIWMVLLLAVAACVGIAAVFLRHRRYAALTMIWAFAGILIRHISQDGYRGQYPVVITAAIIAIILVGMAVLFDAIRIRNANKLRKARCYADGAVKNAEEDSCRICGYQK